METNGRLVGGRDLLAVRRVAARPGRSDWAICLPGAKRPCCTRACLRPSRSARRTGRGR